MNNWANHLRVIEQVKPVIHYAILALISPPILQSEQVTLVEESQSQSADYIWHDSTENHVVYYGHRLRIFSFRLWFDPVGGDQTCLIFSADFRTHIFICYASPSIKEHVSAWVRCDRNNFKVW